MAASSRSSAGVALAGHTGKHPPTISAAQSTLLRTVPIGSRRCSAKTRTSDELAHAEVLGGSLFPDSLGLDHFNEALDAEGPRELQRPADRCASSSTDWSASVGPGKQARDRSGGDGRLEARSTPPRAIYLRKPEALVVALDAGVDDPAMLLMLRAGGSVKPSEVRNSRSEPMACDTAAKLALELATGASASAAGMKPGFLLRTAQEG